MPPRIASSSADLLSTVNRWDPVRAPGGTSRHHHRAITTAPPKALLTSGQRRRTLRPQGYRGQPAATIDDLQCEGGEQAESEQEEPGQADHSGRAGQAVRDAAERVTT